MWALVKATTLLLSVMCISACINPGIKNLQATSQLQADEIVIVGKIAVVPKLEKEEQDFTGTLGNSRAKNKFYLVLDNQMKPLKDYVSMGGMKNMAEVELEKTFAVVVKRGQPLYFTGGLIHLGGSGNLLFPGGLRIKTRKGDQALYIGTIEYTRNIYEEITKVRIKDQYIAAQKKFRKQYGSRIKLKRRKPIPVKSKP